MKNIKICRGIKIRLGIFIFSIFSLISCQKERSEPEKYQIWIENNYFESVLVSINDFFSEKLEKNSTSSVFFLPKGKYIFTCVTPSRLKLESTIVVQGYQPKIFIEITSNGKIIVKDL